MRQGKHSQEELAARRPGGCDAVPWERRQQGPGDAEILLVQDRSSAVRRSFEFNRCLGATGILFQFARSDSIVSRRDVHFVMAKALVATLHDGVAVGPRTHLREIARLVPGVPLRLAVESSIGRPSDVKEEFRAAVSGNISLVQVDSGPPPPGAALRVDECRRSGIVGIFACRLLQFCPLFCRRDTHALQLLLLAFHLLQLGLFLPLGLLRDRVAHYVAHRCVHGHVPLAGVPREEALLAFVRRFPLQVPDGLRVCELAGEQQKFAEKCIVDLSFLGELGRHLLAEVAVVLPLALSVRITDIDERERRERFRQPDRTRALMSARRHPHMCSPLHRRSTDGGRAEVSALTPGGSGHVACNHARVKAVLILRRRHPDLPRRSGHTLTGSVGTACRVSHGPLLSPSTRDGWLLEVDSIPLEPWQPADCAMAGRWQSVKFGAGRGGPGPPLRDGLRRWGATFVLLAAVAATLPIAGGQGFLDEYATWCGDGVCESGIEEAGWCARDCSCGDGVCDESEAIAASCPQECLSRMHITAQPSPHAASRVAFQVQPALRIVGATNESAYAPGSVSASLYHVVEDGTGTKKLNLMDEALFGRKQVPWSCGQARWTDLVVERAGTYSIRFQSSIGTVSFMTESASFVVARGSAHHLSMSVQPAGFRPDYAFKIQPTVKVVDVAENLIEDGPDAATHITASLTADSPQIILQPQNRLVKPARFGAAAFRDLKLPADALGQTIKMQFTAGFLLLPCVSRAFVVAATADRLNVSNFPTAAEAVEPFPHQPKVKVEDQFGNLCTWFDDDAGDSQGVSSEGLVIVAVLLAPKGVAAAMLGEKSKMAIDGRVQFTDLSIDKRGDGYAIEFKIARGIANNQNVKTFTTPLFNVTYGKPHRLVFGRMPDSNTTGSDDVIAAPQGASPGQPLAQQPIVEVQDQAGNIVGDERGILDVRVTLLQNGMVAVPGLKGVSVQKARLYKEGCRNDLAISGCGIARWPVTQNGIRIDSVGKNFTLIFEANFTDGLKLIQLIPVVSLSFDVNYGAPDSLQLVAEPWGFVLNELFLGQPVVALYDKAGNLVPSNGVQVVSHFQVVTAQGGRKCCFEPFTATTRFGYAYFEGVKLTNIPSDGNRLTLKFSSDILDSSIESQPFIMANTPVRIEVTQQPAAPVPGIGFGQLPKIALFDMNRTVSGWYKDEPMKVRATLCVEIPCVSGKFVGSLQTATPCFQCASDEAGFCRIQTQTPPLLKPRIIPTEEELVRGNMTSVAYNGESTFTDLVIDKVGTYKFRFTTAGYAAVDSHAFTIFHGVAHHLHMQAQPKGAHAGCPFRQQPIVVIRDAGRNAVLSDSKTIITASLVNSDQKEDAKLLTANDNIMGLLLPVQHGVLHWQRLRIDVAGTFRLHFNSSLGNKKCTPVTTDSIDITVGSPFRLAVVRAPDICLRRRACLQQPIIEVQDDKGNKASVTQAFNISIISVSCNWRQDLEEQSLSDGRVELKTIGIYEDGGNLSLWSNACDGRYHIVVSAKGLENATSQVFQASEPATNTTAVESVNPGVSGAEFRHQPVVELTDIFGRRVRGASSNVTASLLKCENGGSCKVHALSPVIGSKTIHTSLGRAHFTNLRVDMAGTCYRFQFLAPGMVAGKSRLFDIKLGSEVNVLQVVTNPKSTGAVAGQAFPVQPAVAVLDAGKNVMVFKDSLQITAYLIVDAVISSTALEGAQTAVTKKGVGMFTDLFTTTRFSCLKLKFEVFGKTAYSNSFAVGPASPVKLHLEVEPSGPHVGWPFMMQPVLYVKDVFGNIVNQHDCAVDCDNLKTRLRANLNVMDSLKPPWVPEANTNITLQGNKRIDFGHDAGFGTRASFTDLRIDRAGSYILNFTSESGALDHVVSQEIVVKPAEDRADHLDVIVQPQGFRTMFPFSIQPQIAIRDKGNNIVKTAQTSVSVTLLGGYGCRFPGDAELPDKFKCGPWVASHDECGQRSTCMNSPGGLTKRDVLKLTGTTTVPTKDGVAIFTDLNIGALTRFVQLEFTSDKSCTPSDDICTPAKSFVFDVAGAVSYMELLDEPPTFVVAGEPFSVHPRLGIFDASGRRYTFSSESEVQVANVSSYQTLSTNCSLPETHEHLAGTGYDCNENRTVNGSAVNISQYGVWDRLEGSTKSALFSDFSFNFTDLRFDEAARSKKGYNLKFSFQAPAGDKFEIDWCCVHVGPAEPHSLRILQQPGLPRVGNALEAQPVLRIYDRFGNLATTENGQVSAKLYHHGEPAVSGVVEKVFGSNTATAQAGSVHFQNLGYNRTGSNFTVVFTYSNLPPVASNPFQIDPGNRIYFLRISRQPNGFKIAHVMNGNVQNAFAVQPVVETLDLGSNLIAPDVAAADAYHSQTPSIKVSLINCTSCQLLGQTLQDAHNGAASFIDLGIASVGSGMRLRFTLSDSVAVYTESDSFEVSGNETSLVFQEMMSTMTTGGTKFGYQPVLRLQDDQGRLVSRHSDMVVSAALWVYGSTETCSEGDARDRPFRCNPKRVDNACTKNEAACPTLRGATSSLIKYGVAVFDDLTINECNENKDGCVRAKYKIVFTTTSPVVLPRQLEDGSILDTGGELRVESPPLNVTIGPGIAAVLTAQPIPGKPGSVFVTPPVVVIQDQGGNQVVDWDHKMSATLVRGLITACCDQCETCESPSWSGTTPVNAVQGAFNLDISINTAGKNYKLTFVTGLLTVESSFFEVEVGAATHLRLIRQPLPGLTLYGGSYFQVQPRLEVLDAGLNVVKGYEGSVKAELLPNEYGAILMGTITTSVVNGEAQFVTLAINKEGSCYVLRFSSDSLKGVDSRPLAIDAEKTSRISFIQKPDGYLPGYAFKVPPIVAVVDEGGNVVPTAQDWIEVTLLDKDLVPRPLCSFSLLGAPVCQTSIKAVNGIATFSGLRVDTAGKGYTLQFGKRGGGYKTVTSDAFDVNVGPAFQLIVARQPNISNIATIGGGKGQPGYTLRTQPIITIHDAGGNQVMVTSRKISAELYRINQQAISTKPESWELQMQPHSAAYDGIQSAIDRVLTRPSFEGKAIFSNLQVDVAGSGYSLRFRSDELLAVDSVVFSIDVGAASKVKIRRMPAGIKSGQAFVVQPIVHIVDRGLNTLRDLNPTYKMISAIVEGVGVMYPFPAEYGILPIIDGVTEFKHLTISGRGEHIIKFSAWDFFTDTTVRFNVSGESHALSIKTQPGGTGLNCPSDPGCASSVLQIQPELYVLDDRKVVVDTDDSSKVTASIIPHSNPNNAVLLGTLTINCCWGQCKFTDLVISKAGQKYQLRFEAKNLTLDTSRPFEIGGPTNLTVHSEPAAAISGSPIGNQPVVHVTDMRAAKQEYCNLDRCDIGAPALVTANIKSGTGCSTPDGKLDLCSLQGNTIAPVVNGAATFTNLGVKGAGRSFQERPYVLVFTARDLYTSYTTEFSLGYVPRLPEEGRDYVQAAVQLTGFTVQSFTVREQIIFVRTLAKYLGVANDDVEIVSVKDVMITFRDEVRRVPSPFPLRDLASRRLGQKSPGQQLLQQSQRRRQEPGIDVRFRIFAVDHQKLFDIKKSLTELLKREGGLAEQLSNEGFPTVKVVMTEAPEAYLADGGLLPPIVKNDPTTAIAGALIGLILVVACAVCGYTAWFRARKRALIKAETEADEINLLYALGIEDPKEDLDSAMPWTAEKMLESSSESLRVVRPQDDHD